MRRKASTILIVISLFLVWSFSSANVYAPSLFSIIIHADGSIYPATAPIFTADNLTYTFMDDINIPVSPLHLQGILVERDNVTLDGNGHTLSSSIGFAVYLAEVHNVTVKNLGIRGFYYGVAAINSQFITISSNMLGCGESAVWLSLSSYCTISENEIAVFRRGICLFSSSYNIIKGNTIAGTGIAVLLHQSSNNMIYHNSLRIARVELCTYNSWDNGYPSGGNYWRGYTGVDANNDGIGDTPRVIGEDNVDRYPLMKPWAPVVTANVSICPSTLNLMSKGRWVYAYIRLPEGYEATDIIPSSIMLNNTVPASMKCYKISDALGLTVKFSREEVIHYILNPDNSDGRFTTVTLTITGSFENGTQFQGSDLVKVIMSISKHSRLHSFRQ